MSRHSHGFCNPTGINDVYRRGGGSVTFMLVLITEHHTLLLLLEARLNQSKTGAMTTGAEFFKNNDLFDSIQERKTAF